MSGPVVRTRTSLPGWIAGMFTVAAVAVAVSSFGWTRWGDGYSYLDTVRTATDGGGDLELILWGYGGLVAVLMLIAGVLAVALHLRLLTRRDRRLGNYRGGFIHRASGRPEHVRVATLACSPAAAGILAMLVYWSLNGDRYAMPSIGSSIARSLLPLASVVGLTTSTLLLAYGLRRGPSGFAHRDPQTLTRETAH